MFFGIWMILAGLILMIMFYSLHAAPIFMILSSIIMTIGMMYTSHLFDELEERIEKLENEGEELRKQVTQSEKFDKPVIEKNSETVNDYRGISRSR